MLLNVIMKISPSGPTFSDLYFVQATSFTFTRMHLHLDIIVSDKRNGSHSRTMSLGRFESLLIQQANSYPSDALIHIIMRSNSGNSHIKPRMLHHTPRIQTSLETINPVYT